MKRKKIPMQVVREVLTESGYKCAVPTCRNILVIDIHHMVQVSEGGGNVLSNLLALCPNCHSLHHKHIISRDSIYAWKLMLVSLSRAFDTNAMDDLLFLKQTPSKKLQISGDGVLKFSRLNRRRTRGIQAHDAERSHCSLQGSSHTERDSIGGRLDEWRS